MLKLQEKLFFSSIVRIVLLLLLLGGNVCYHLWLFLRGDVIEGIKQYGYVGYFPYQMHIFSIFFLIMLFISYDFFCELSDAGFKEICQVESTYLKMDIMQGIVLLQWIVLSALIVFGSAIFGFYLANTMNTDIFFYLVKLIFLYIVMNGCVSVLLSWCLSRSVGKMIGYICIMLFGCAVSPIFTSEVTFLSMLFEGIYDVFKAFLIMPEGIMYRNEHVLFPVNYSLVARSFFWIVLFALGVLSLYKVRFKQILFVCLIVLLTGSIVYINRPYSFYSANDSYGESDSISYDQMCYELDVVSEDSSIHDERFEVEKYEMDFNVKNSLDAIVKVYLKEKNLNEYPLTLYHLYNVKSVCDENGNPLLYQRNGDYITVSNSDGMLNCICLEYQGYLSNFYANKNEMFLPGWFAYYPMPGYRVLYQDYEYVDNMFDEKVEFNINVNTNQLVYSDLKHKSKNHFYGTSYGPTLISGFVSEMNLDHNIRLIYPYLDKTSDPSADVSADDYQFTMQYLSNVWDERTENVIIITPSLAGQCANCVRDGLVVGYVSWKSYASNINKTGTLLNKEVGVSDAERRELFLSYYELMKADDMISYEMLKQEWDSLCQEETISDEEFQNLLIELIGKSEYERIMGIEVN